MVFRLKEQFKGLYKGDTRVAIWEQHRLLYVRIPKSANSSVLAAIDGARKCRMSGGKIARMNDQWTCFSFVRNPWSRLVSSYRQKASTDATSKRIVDGVYQGFVDKGMPIRANMSFEEFCEVVCEFPNEKIDKHLQSQAYTLIRNGKAIVPFIGKVEHMNADWKTVMDKVGLNNELPHINQTSGQHYSSYFTSDALINRIADRYADDIRYFEYDFVRK
ncbi:MAG TPA: hypothetical protein DDW55_02680 [Gammaproteobacteria bacterium]|nr:hypothetical protein [Gammaproteobacteria bacterium]